MLFSLGECEIILFTNKTTSREDSDAVHKLLPVIISENIAYLLKLGKYGAINARYPTTMGCCVIKYLSEPYTLQEDQAIYGKVSKESELVAKVEYFSILNKKSKLVLSTSRNKSECHHANLYHFSFMYRCVSYKEC